MYDLKLLADSLWNAMITEMNVDISSTPDALTLYREHCAIEFFILPVQQSWHQACCFSTASWSCTSCSMMPSTPCIDINTIPCGVYAKDSLP